MHPMPPVLKRFTVIGAQYDRPERLATVPGYAHHFPEPLMVFVKGIKFSLYVWIP